MDFNSLKSKLINTIGQAADGAKDLAGKAGESARVVAGKAKDMGRVAKLNMEIAAERDTMKKAFLEIGRMYYEANQGAPDPLFAQLFGEVDLAKKNIAGKEAEIEVLKGDGEPEVSVEFEEVVAAEEAAEGCCCAPETPEQSCCCAPEAPAEAPEQPCCCAPETPEEPCCCAPETPEEPCCCAPETPAEAPEQPAEDGCCCRKDDE